MIGIIANNRFLQRTNPLIRAALTSGGNILRNDRIQQSTRKMVDMGIVDSLVCYVAHDLLTTSYFNNVDIAHDLVGLGNSAVTNAQIEIRPTHTVNGIGFHGINNNRMRVVNNSSINLTGALTLMLWVYPTAGNTKAQGWVYNNIVTKESIYSNGFGITLYPRFGGSSSGNFAVQSWIRNGGTSHSANWLYPNEAAFLNSWFYIVMSFDGVNKLSIYVNGNLGETVTTTIFPASSTYDLALGQTSRPQGADRAFFGDIGTVRLFNEGLTAAQQLEIYNYEQLYY